MASRIKKLKDAGTPATKTQRLAESESQRYARKDDDEGGGVISGGAKDDKKKDKKKNKSRRPTDVGEEVPGY